MIPLSDLNVRPRTLPFINYALLIANALVFLYELSIGPTAREAFFFRYGLIPRELTEGMDFTSVRGPGGAIDIASPFNAWGTMFTAMFIHGDVLHFGLNMLFLWVFGANVEDLFGHIKYLLFYIVFGVVAALTQVVIDPQGEIPMIGASGAIAGALGAYFLRYPFSQIKTAVVVFFIFFIRIPAFVLLGSWILLQFVEGFGRLGTSAQQGGTAYFAHIGGFIAGMIWAAVWTVFRREPLWPRKSRDQWWRGRRF